MCQSQSVGISILALLVRLREERIALLTRVGRVVTVVVTVAWIFRHEHAVDKTLSAMLIRAEGVATGILKGTARLLAPPIVDVVVVVVVSISVVVVVVVVVVESVSVDVVVVVVESTSVDVVVVNVVVVVEAGVAVEIVVEVPIFNKLLQKEAAGASSVDRTDRMLLTSWQTSLTIGLIGKL
jgi:hypothetical protein